MQGPSSELFQLPPAVQHLTASAGGGRQAQTIKKTDQTYTTVGRLRSFIFASGMCVSV